MIIFLYEPDLHKKTGEEEDCDADLVNHDIYIAPLCILFESNDCQFWIAPNWLVAHVVQDCRHVVLVHNVLGQREVVIVGLHEKK